MANSEQHELPLPSTKPAVRSRTVYTPFGFCSEQMRGMGVSSCVWDVPVVFKSPKGEKEMAMLEREQEVYNRLGGSSSHPGLLTYYGRVADCLILSVAEHGSIRQYYAWSRPSWAVDLPTKLRWIREIAATFEFIHSHDVLHCDVSSNNIFLDGDLTAKVADFAGSAIGDKRALSWYETSHSLPSYDEASMRSDCFALGSTFYEILTGKPPFYALQQCEIEERFSTQCFPELHSLPACRDIIDNCWHENYSTTRDLVSDTEAEGLFSHLIY